MKFYNNDYYYIETPPTYKADLFQKPEQEQDWSKWIVPYKDQLPLFVGGAGCEIQSWKEMDAGKY